MIVAESHEDLIEIPKQRDTGRIFKPAIIGDTAQSALRDWVLLQLHFVVDVDSEIPNKNIEGDLRVGRDQDGVGIVLGMVEVKRITDTKIEAQSVELSDRPDGIDIGMWFDDPVVFLVGAFEPL